MTWFLSSAASFSRIILEVMENTQQRLFGLSKCLPENIMTVRVREITVKNASIFTIQMGVQELAIYRLTWLLLYDVIFRGRGLKNDQDGRSAEI